MERSFLSRDRGGCRWRYAVAAACCGLPLLFHGWAASGRQGGDSLDANGARSYRLTNHHDDAVEPASAAFAPPPLPVVTDASRRKIEHYQEELPTISPSPQRSGNSAALRAPSTTDDQPRVELPYDNVLSQAPAAPPVRPLIPAAPPRQPAERRVIIAPPVVESPPIITTETQFPVTDAAAPNTWETPRAAPPASSLSPDRSMQAVVVRVDQRNRRGFELAGRGALYSARAEFIKSLRLLAHALDAQQGTSRHTDALADGWLALEEADDFVDRGLAVDRRIDVRAAIAAHRTVVLKAAPETDLTPLIALTRYYSYAQEQLAVAVEQELTGSVALYGLGKVHATLAAADPASTVAGAPKAMALYQAAMAVDSANALAAHELGVLLARCGQFDAARDALIHSAARASHPETWRSLATVLERLGDYPAAAQARQQADASAARPSGVVTTTGSPQQPLVWMEPAQFANTSISQADVTSGPRPAAAPAAIKPDGSPPNGAKSAWPWPIRMGVNTK